MSDRIEARTVASSYDVHSCLRIADIQGRRPEPPQERGIMAKNHYVTKPKRRNKSGKRKDPSAATMAKLRQRAAAETKK